MAFSKARRLSDFIAADGTIPTGKFASSSITSSHLVDGTIAHADLHTNMDLTGKTVLIANASTGDNDTTAANTAFVQQEIAALVDSSPSALNTLNELAAALGDDANFSTTVTNSIATKAPIANPTFTGGLTLNSGHVNIDSGLSYQWGDSHERIEQSDGKIEFFTNNGEAMTLSGDSLGIGTDNPTSRLSIVGGATNPGLSIKSGGNSGVDPFKVTWTNGTEGDMFIVDDNGNVGIGLTNPSEKLEVSGKIKLGGMRLANNDSGRIGLNRNPDDGSATTGSLRRFQINGPLSGSDYLDFQSYNSSGTYQGSIVLKDGNIGIGVTDPDTKLEVKGTSAAPSATAQILSVTNTAGGTRLDLGVTENSYGWIQAREGSTLRNLLLNSAGGNVGIGTDNPNSPLHVKTTNQSIQIRNTGNDNVGLEIYRDSDGAKGASIGWGNGNANLEIKNYRNDGQSGGPYANIDFFTGGTNADSPDYAPTRRMRIQQTGEVGIGVDDPISQLHVNKDTSGHNTDGITLGKVEANGWIDINEEMGRLGWAASYGSSFTPAIGAYISAKADANWNGNEAPTRLGFFTAPENSLTPVERVRIDKTGAVTQPYQPTAIYTHAAGTEQGAYAYDYGTSSGSVAVTCRPQSAVVNRGNIYNTGNGRFTAPVAGVYRYGVHGNLYTAGIASNAYWTLRIFKNSAHYIYHYEHNSTRAAGSWIYVNAGGLIELAANEYITIQLVSNVKTGNNIHFGWDIANYTHYEFQLLY